MVALLASAFALLRVDMSAGPPALVFQLTIAFLYMPMPFVAGVIVERVAGRRLLLWDTFADFGRKWWRIGLFSVLTAVAVYVTNMGLVVLLGNALHVPGVGYLVATQQAVLGNLQAASAGRCLPALLKACHRRRRSLRSVSSRASSPASPSTGSSPSERSTAGAGC